MEEWKKGKPETAGLFWVAISDDENPVRLLMIIEGFGKALHFRTLFPFEFDRNRTYKHIANLDNCTAYTEVEIPKFEPEVTEEE